MFSPEVDARASNLPLPPSLPLPLLIPPMDDAPPPADTDAAEDAFVEAVVRAVNRGYPASPITTRRRIAQLYIRQALGVEPPPGVISETTLGQYLGLSQQRVSDLYRQALTNAATHLLRTSRQQDPVP